eukprot:188548-Pyramimonas_sp.AAC.1
MSLNTSSALILPSRIPICSTAQRPAPTTARTHRTAIDRHTYPTPASSDRWSPDRSNDDRNVDAVIAATRANCRNHNAEPPQQ